jgi:hypothetical protein
LTSFGNSGSELLFGTPIPSGSIITGSWTFERTLTDQEPTRHDLGTYVDQQGVLVLRAAATSVRITGRSGLGVVDEEFQDSLFIRTDMLPIGFQFFSFGTFFSGHPSTFTSDAFPSVAALNGMSGEFDLEADVIGHIRGCEDCPSVALFGPAQITAAPAPVPEPTTLLLFATGAAAVARRVWKRRQRAS